MKADKRNDNLEEGAVIYVEVVGSWAGSGNTKHFVLSGTSIRLDCRLTVSLPLSANGT
jgi:hypothetical protein